MPISIDEWERGRTSTTLESRIESFLTRNNEQAFTLAEIASNMYAIRFDSTKDVLDAFLLFFNIGGALRILIGEGKVKARLIRVPNGEEMYYAVDRPFKLGTQ